MNMSINTLRKLQSCNKHTLIKSKLIILLMQIILNKDKNSRSMLKSKTVTRIKIQMKISNKLPSGNIKFWIVSN